MSRIRCNSLLGLIFASFFVSQSATFSRILHRVKRRMLSNRDKSTKIPSPSSGSKGSILAFRRPTSRDARIWFSWSELRDYNHDTAGMTKPLVDVQSEEGNADGLDSNCKEKQRDWWPKHLHNDESSTTTKYNGSWKVLTWHRRVGIGRQCYEAVRDKALDWEFHQEEKGKRQGIVAVGDLAQKSRSYSDVDWAARSTLAYDGPARHLVTYTRKLGGLCWIVNPVRILYECVDNRGPATTFTSTAYATLKGHWLIGEERVTVALRDEDQSVNVEITSFSKLANWWMSVSSRMGIVTKMQKDFFLAQMKYFQTVADEIR